MGIFNKKIELTQKDYDKINSLLPDHLKGIWDAQYITDGKLILSYLNYRKELEKNLIQLNNRLSNINKSKKTSIASKVLIFNTEIYNAEPLGMVDVGIIERFGATSTGNRFENGLVGYAIEGAFDNVWANNNSQFSAVENAKLELLIKAREIYPECNMLFKFEIDFREIGTSGNVFIYARGTASKGQNKLLLNLIAKIEEDEVKTKSEIEQLEKKLKFIRENEKNIPETRKELEDFISEG